MPKKCVLINFINYQIAWFACVLGAANHWPWLGVVVTLVIVSWHLYQSASAKNELKLLCITLCIGGLFDQLLLSSALVDYTAHGWGTLHTLVPVWILALWFGFATSLNVTLRWMRGQYWLAMGFGLIGGPLAYLGAEKLGAVSLNGTLSLVALAIGWAAIMPCLIVISSQLDGFESTFEELRT